MLARKSMIIALGFAGMVVLNGCGGGSSSGGGGGSVPSEPRPSLAGIDIANLPEGYIVDGHNEAGESVQFQFCRNQYEYYSGQGHWYGHFGLKDDRINMFDYTPTGGSYRIDTGNYMFEVGREYFIDFQNDEIIVDAINEDPGC